MPDPLVRLKIVRTAREPGGKHRNMQQDGLRYVASKTLGAVRKDGGD